MWSDELIKNRTQIHQNFHCDAVSEAGGMMTLTDAYVRLNRARGLELISPEDLLDACQSLDSFENSSLSTCSSHVFTNYEFSIFIYFFEEGHFYKTQWAWQGVKLTRLMSIFTSKSLEIFDKNSANTILSKKDKEWKESPLMPIRVNYCRETHRNKHTEGSIDFFSRLHDFFNVLNSK